MPGDARVWLATMIETLKQDDQVCLFVNLWAIWHARRKAIHEQVYQSPMSVHCFVESFIADLKQGEEARRSQPVVSARPAMARWIPPPRGMVKINVDAAVSKNSQHLSAVAVARSDGGVFLGASAVVFQGCTDPETLEALACREAVALALDLDARRIKVASDCKSVISSLEEGTRGSYAHIVQEIIAARSRLEELVFCHEGRRTNKEAHSLARCVVSSDQGRRVWFVQPPEGLGIPLYYEV